MLYMPLVREHLELESEKEIKEAISKVGGVNNSSGIFLHPNSTGQLINRHSVSIIPQTLCPKSSYNVFLFFSLISNQTNAHNFRKVPLAVSETVFFLASTYIILECMLHRDGRDQKKIQKDEESVCKNM